MSQVEANLRKGQIRFASWILILVPLFCVLFAYLLDMGRQATVPPSWLTVAKVALGVVALYCLAAPFLMERVIARSAERVRAKGHDPNQATALVCIGGSIGPSTFATFLAMAGAPTALVYTWAPVSLLSAAYWGWRYRHVLGAKGHRAA